jgi:hypothetical protein
MLKRIKMEKHLEVILAEMCTRVGTKLEKVNILQQDWQEKYEWTIEQEKDFQEWMCQYLQKNKDALFEISTYRPDETLTPTELMNLVKEFTLFYGWALEEEPNFEYIKENNPEKN